MIAVQHNYVEHDRAGGIVEKPYLQYVGASRYAYESYECNKCAAEMHSNLTDYRTHCGEPDRV